MEDAARNGLGVKTTPNMFNDTCGPSGTDGRGTSVTMTQEETARERQTSRNANGVEGLEQSKDDIG